jgi:serine phosphatase RsbU (regulator of sigma subunit)/DNA-binding response OmpR family regulator/anti-sigma regulatory factor (Ser/Thr protein kinase)
VAFAVSSVDDRLDAQADDDVVVPPDRDQIDVDPGRAEPGGILLVDDHRENLTALEAVLEPLGQRLISVDSGEDALRALLHEEVAVILLDVRMAGLDGVETARIIRSRPATRHIPVIFLTALVSDAEQIELAYATGAVDYVIKPFEPSILRAKVMAFVTLARERAERLRQSRARAIAEAAARAVRTLQSLSDVALAHLDLAPLSHELLERACALFGADGALLLLSDDSASSDLRPFAARGEHVVASDQNIVDASGGAVAGIMDERRVAVLAEASPERRELEQSLPGGGLESFAALLAVPLTTDDQALGLLLLAAHEADAFDPADLELLGLAADRIGTAIDHARRFEHERQQVVVLQSSLLPDSLPEHPRLELAARYLPGQVGAQIGGDWYDALQLDRDRMAVMIGDIVGHGTAAAARMGELRNGLRAYVAEGHSPAEALRRLDKLAAVSRGEEMVATVLLLIADTARGLVTVSRAGHPPALIRGADGEVRTLESENTLPIGVMRNRAPDEVIHSFAEGETLLLYTDGLVERRAEPIDEGIARLRQALSEAPADAEALSDHVIARVLADRPGSDDVAMLAMRLLGAPEGALELSLPAVSGSVTIARHRVREWLRVNAPELDRDARSDLEVALTEACSNVVRHAYGPADASFQVTALREGDAVALAITDQGHWRPPRGDHGGRGLVLMRALCDDVQIEKASEGTTVSLRRRLARAPLPSSVEPR